MPLNSVTDTEIRRLIVETAANCGESAHLGGSLSMVELLNTLFGGFLRHRPESPQWEDRDIFILSKGHAVLGYLAVLHAYGYFDRQKLATFQSNGSDLIAHPVKKLELGIESSNGSLGQGLSFGLGVAIGMRKRGQSHRRVFVMMGDGECNEGSVWESAISASHFGLSNLTVVIDKNGLQYDGATENILNMGDLASKFESFGWSVQVVNGHDIGELLPAFDKQSQRPSAIVANTIKGKGVPYMENNATWHHSRLSQKQFDEIIKDREKR